MDNIAQTLSDPISPAFDLMKAATTPFASEIIQITKQEHIELICSTNYWKSQDRQKAKKIECLERTIELLKAKIKDLNQRLYGKKTEKGVTKTEKTSQKSSSNDKRPRGQQKNTQGHGRTKRPHLPTVEEIRDLPENEKSCSICHKPYKELCITEDSQITEIKVKAHIRNIRRKCYESCCCQGGPTSIITASRAPRLIPKSQLGISVWERILLDKYLYMIPTYRDCIQLKHMGLPMSLGTITGGLQKMIPYFEPLVNRMLDKQMTEKLFQGDETGWKVFEEIVGKVGYKWWLWLVRSPSVIFFHMSPSRSGDIPIEHFSNLPEESKQGEIILLCDRYSAYKRLSREFPFILLAFCWAHVRRDFLDAGRKYPDLNEWMLDWVEAIGTLYHMNKLRLEHWDNFKDIDQQSGQFKVYHAELKANLKAMFERRDELLTADENEKDYQKKLHSQQKAVLNSLVTHEAGLTVFVDHPEVNMDNNGSERPLRNPVTGRKCYYGSGAQWSAKFAALMFTTFQTILLWGLNPHTWLHLFLNACAEQGEPLTDFSEFLAWEMSEARKQQLRQPISSSANSTDCLEILDEAETIDSS